MTSKFMEGDSFEKDGHEMIKTISKGRDFRGQTEGQKLESQ